MDYLEFDEFGIEKIRCMSCKAEIVRRSYVEVQSKTDPSKTEKVLAMTRLGNYTQVKVNMSDGTYCEILCCKSCSTSEKELDLPALMLQIKKGWLLEEQWAGRPQSQIDLQLSKYEGVSLTGRM